MAIKIILADDHRLMREGLRLLLETQPGIEIVAEAENGRETLQLVRKYKPDVVLMDIAMPDLNGIDATRQIVSEFPKIKIIALSMHTNKKFIVEMLTAGASGYLIKDSALEELSKAINTVINNRIYLSPIITSVVVEDYRVSKSPADIVSPVSLTSREREVLQLIAEGKTTKEIAACLNLSVKTIETHRMQMMNKLNMHSVAELTKYAIREGITTP
jgi:two-component system, NarL family, response regulator NreC